MRICTVHEPPPARRGPAREPEDFVFVRDGFYFWAFLFGPLWMAYRRLWLVLLLYLLVVIPLNVALIVLGVMGPGSAIVHLLIALLVGLEAGTFWRWTLRRRGYGELGAVAAADLEAAEQRFFEARNAEPAAARQPRQAAPHYAQPVPRSASHGSDIVGLFPEPGAPR